MRGQVLLPGNHGYTMSFHGYHQPLCLHLLALFVFPRIDPQAASGHPVPCSVTGRMTMGHQAFFPYDSSRESSQIFISGFSRKNINSHNNKKINPSKREQYLCFQGSNSRTVRVNISRARCSFVILSRENTISHFFNRAESLIFSPCLLLFRCGEETVGKPAACHMGQTAQQDPLLTEFSPSTACSTAQTPNQMCQGFQQGGDRCNFRP